jgi:hypothetical protein
MRTLAAFALVLSALALPLKPQGAAIEQAQARAKGAPRGPAPRTPGGHPDLSGLWGPDRNFIYNIESALAPGETLPIQPWAARLAAERMSKDDPEANCLPTGVPRQAPYPWRIIQLPDYVYFLFEGNIHSYRQIFMNRPHTPDPDPTWYGESVAHWDGDTLVVDTIGFNELFWFDFAGHPHTSQLRVIERFRRPDFGHLDYDVTIDDPGAYTRPFVLHGHSTLETDTELMEYICNENNQDVPHITGKDMRR